MNHSDPDALRLLTRERHERRLREAEAERLARVIRGSARRRRRPPLTFGLSLEPFQRARQPQPRTSTQQRGL